MARKIEVVNYNPNWNKEYKDEAKKLKEILGKNCVGMFHIGSTAVKGMKAKPTIDIMPVVKDMTLVKEKLRKFEELGYRYMGECGIEGRLFFIKGEENHTHHLHIYEEKNKRETSRHLAFREYLKRHPEIANEYSELKMKLAEEFTYDSEGYCNGKDTYVKAIEEKAIKWTEKQLHQGNYSSMGMCLGLAIGMIVGNATGNQATGMCLGMCIGLAIGTAIGHSKNDE